MKEKIIAYLSGPRPYREGIALYEEYGLNLMLKASFRRNAETDLLRATLMEELRKLAGIPETAFRTMQRKAAGSPHISSASIVVGEIKAEETAVNVPVTPVVENVIRFRDRFPFLNSPDCPDVLKILVADMFTAYDLYLKTFRELGELPDDVELEQAKHLWRFRWRTGVSGRCWNITVITMCYSGNIRVLPPL